MNSVQWMGTAVNPAIFRLPFGLKSFDHLCQSLIFG